MPGHGAPLFELRPPVLTGWDWAVKRVFDIVVSVLVAVLFLPLWVLIALAVKLDSRGPVFFVDRRVGVGEREFGMLKFRTMVGGSRLAAGARGRERGRGRALQDPRRSAGDARRPCPPPLVARRDPTDRERAQGGDEPRRAPAPIPLRDYELLETWHRARYSVLPGMTGLWQISGRSGLTFDDLVRLDFTYLEEEATMAKQLDGVLGRRSIAGRVLKTGAAGAGAAGIGARSDGPAGTSAQGVTIRVLVPQGALADGLIKTAPAYQTETGNTIEVEAFPYAELQTKAVTLTQVKSDEYDLFFVDDPWMPNLNPAESAVAIDEEFGYERDPDIFEVCYDVFSWPPPYGPVPQSVREQELEPHLYGLPVVGNVILYTIREDILASGASPSRRPGTTPSHREAVDDPGAPFYGWNAAASRRQRRLHPDPLVARRRHPGRRIQRDPGQRGRAENLPTPQGAGRRTARRDWSPTIPTSSRPTSWAAGR